MKSKVQKIGNLLGVILPDEVLADKSKDGAYQLALGIEIMQRHHGILQGLADNPVDHSLHQLRD